MNCSQADRRFIPETSTARSEKKFRRRWRSGAKNSKSKAARLTTVGNKLSGRVWQKPPGGARNQSLRLPIDGNFPCKKPATPCGANAVLVKSCENSRRLRGKGLASA